MKVKTIRVKVDQRVKIMDFESFAPNVEMSADLDDDDNAETCIQNLFFIAKRMWAKEAMKELRWNRSRTKDVKAFDELAATTVTALKKMMVDGK